MDLLFLFALIIPIVFSFLAVKSNLYRFKSLVTLTCILLIITSSFMYSTLFHSTSNIIYYLLTAFCFSILGDYFLSFREGKKNFYLYGILGFFIAHVFYLLYVLQKSPRWIITVVLFLFLIIVFTVYFFVRIVKHIQETSMKWAVFFYLFISSLTLSVTLTCTTSLIERILLALGVGLIVISDVCIAENDFAENHLFYRFILPTYYLAHILLTASVLFSI